MNSTRTEFSDERKQRLERLKAPEWDRPAVGLMLRYAWRNSLDTFATHDRPLTWLEVFPENYFRRGGARLANLLKLAEDFPITSHGVHLSVAGDALDDAYIDELAQFLEVIDAPWASDHLGVSVHKKKLLHEILPAVRSRESLARLSERLDLLRARMPCEFCLENAAYYMTPPGCTLSELEFLIQLIENDGLKLIFDVNNLWVNACNHDYDPNEFLAALPKRCVREIHIGGFSVDSQTGLFIDSHSAMPSPPVWHLLELALKRFGPVPVLLEIERDDVAPRGIRRALGRIYDTFEQARPS